MTVEQFIQQVRNLAIKNNIVIYKLDGVFANADKGEIKKAVAVTPENVEDINQITVPLKMTSEEKAEALRVYILEECKTKGITVNEFETVLRKLSYAISKRQSELADKELIPKDKAISEYYHSF